MKRAVFVLLLFAAATASAQEFRARVDEVHSGNTVTIHEAGRRGSAVVRLEGIAVPGRWRPYAAKSRESLRQLVKYKNVTVIPRSRDRYGRMTATLLIDGLDAGLEQIRRGMAWYDEDEADIPEYRAAESDAERQGVGLWAQRR